MQAGIRSVPLHEMLAKGIYFKCFLKGKSSYVLRKEFAEELKEKLWGEHFWSPSYCVVSCGGAPLEIVRKYIEDQRVPTIEKHVKQS